MIYIVGSMLLLASCGRKEEGSGENFEKESTLSQESTKETVPFLQELATQEEESTEESVADYLPVSVGGGAGIGANLKVEARHLLDKGVYADDEEAYMIGQTLLRWI